jgi:hypothetical protein
LPIDGGNNYCRKNADANFGEQMFDDAITLDKMVVARKFGKSCQQLKSTSAIEGAYVRPTRESLVGRNLPSECEAKYYHWNKMSIPSDTRTAYHF